MSSATKMSAGPATSCQSRLPWRQRRTPAPRRRKYVGVGRAVLERRCSSRPVGRHDQRAAVAGNRAFPAAPATDIFVADAADVSRQTTCLLVRHCVSVYPSGRIRVSAAVYPVYPRAGQPRIQAQCGVSADATPPASFGRPVALAGAQRSRVGRGRHARSAPDPGPVLPGVDGPGRRGFPRTGGATGRPNEASPPPQKPQRRRPSPVPESGPPEASGSSSAGSSVDELLARLRVDQADADDGRGRRLSEPRRCGFDDQS
jgi:hypothetical protein